MKKTALLNQPLSNIIAGMGHMDSLVIADAGLPIPKTTTRIDLAVSKGIPSFLDVVCVALAEMQVQEAIIAEEMIKHSPEMYNKLRDALSGIPIKTLSHTEFKNQTAEACAVVRTGEFTAYANVILISGVVF